MNSKVKNHTAIVVVLFLMWLMWIMFSIIVVVNVDYVFNNCMVG